MPDPEGRAAAAEVAPFDPSVDGFFTAMRAIEELTGAGAHVDSPAIDRFASTVIFLIEWKSFQYVPRTIRFNHPNVVAEGKDTSVEIDLPPFSSAVFPQHLDQPLQEQLRDVNNGMDSTDFILHAGGHVWALDWCPRIPNSADISFNCEFLAVAAHSPDTGYHRIGAPLFGRGAVQIWCLVTQNDKMTYRLEERKPRKRKHLDSSETVVAGPKRPRGRPRKVPLPLVDSSEIVALCLEKPGSKLQKASLPFLDSSETVGPSLKRPRGRPRKVRPSSDETPKRGRGRPKKNQDHPVILVSAELKEGASEHDNNNCSVGAHTKLVQGLSSNEVTNTSTLVVYSGTEGVVSPMEGTPIVSSLPDEKSKHPMTQKRRGRPPKKSPGSINVNTPESAAIVSDKLIKKRRGRPPKKTCGSVNVNMSESSALSSSKPGSPIPNAVSNEMAVLKNCSGYPGKSTPPTCGEFSSDCGYKDTEDKCPPTLSCTKTIDEVEAECAVPSDVIPDIMPSHSRNDLLKDISVGYKSHVICKRSPALQREQPKDNMGKSAKSSKKLLGNGDVIPTTDNTRPVPKHLASPRVVLCLAHNGKVAWDIKWRPLINQQENDVFLGFLAVILGDGSLEVWEVPSPRVVRDVYSSSRRDVTDPRFLKLKPVFRNAHIRCGSRQSIPLTLDWSPSPPHDMILVGCHDGSVALWKFSPKYICEDTRPLLCFSADSVPIRSLSWAPCKSGEECSNVFVTGGHDGLRFWDIRDPCRALWDHSTSPRSVLRLEWSMNPRCLIVVLDDGTLRLLGLENAVNDTPVTGKPFSGSSGSTRNHFLSLFSLWDIHVSRITGIAAYCGADGSAIRFRLTDRFVDKSQLRSKNLFYLCGSIAESGEVLVCSPLQDSPLPNLPLRQTKRGAPALPQTSTKPAHMDHEPAQETTGDQIPASAFDERSPESNQGGLHLTYDQEAAARMASSTGPADQGAVRSLCKLSGVKLEGYAPKLAALNRVRWNTNKGSERWLCFGGAAGIVRCQKVPPLS